MKHLVVALLSVFLVSCVSERDIVLDAARTGNTASRVMAIQKLADGPWDDKAEDVVVAALSDHSPLVRKTAATALSGRGISVAWPLTRRLKDGDLRVRVQVVRSLHSLPSADFIVTSLIAALADPSQMVRAEVVEGFLKRGWKPGEILAWRAFQERLSGLEQLTAHAVTDKAAGLEQLARLREPEDFAFLYAALYHSDPFLVQIAARALARGGEPEHLERILAAGGPEPETLLTTWLESTPELTLETFSRLRTRLPPADFHKVLQRRRTQLACAWFNADLPLALVSLLPAGCPVGDQLPLAARWTYLRLHGQAPAELTTEVLARIDLLDEAGLRLLAADPQTLPALLDWFSRQWAQYVSEFEKWIPQGKWQALELVGADEMATEQPSPGTPVDRLLDSYRSRTSAVEETELFLPEFDVPGFARRLSALSGIPGSRELLVSMLSVAPPPVLAQALQVLASITGPRAALPDAVKNALTSEDAAIRSGAVAVVAAAGDASTLIQLMKSAEPSVQETILSALEKTPEPSVISSLFQLFQEEPTARLALALARLQAPGIRIELQSLLAEDTAQAMSEDRATLLLALSLSGPPDEMFRQLVLRELWHPSPRVRCMALSLSQPGDVSAAAFVSDPDWEVRSCARKKLDKGPATPGL